MLDFGNAMYPALIQQDDEGMFCVYFPTIFPESGWEYPLSKGKTRRAATKNAQKELAFALAGFIYDNEEMPEQIPISSNKLSKGMELIDVETSFEPYAEEIQVHLKGRHWHIGYYSLEKEEYFEAIGFKNDEGKWDIFYEDYSDGQVHPDETLLFTVKKHSEAEEKFKQYIENVILKRRG